MAANEDKRDPLMYLTPGQSFGTNLSRRAVVCLSGGMDSTALLLHLLARGVAVHGLSFDYGQRHRVELVRLGQNLQYLKNAGREVDWRKVNLADLGRMLDSALTCPDREMPVGHYEQENMRETVVPNRNAIFASIAWGWAWSLSRRFGEPVMLGLGVHAGDHAIYPDCRPEFYRAIEAAFAAGNWEAERVPLFLPFLAWDKAAILRDALGSVGKLELDFDTVFRNTCTSYAPDAGGRSHGLTGSDVERILAFHEIGRQDPLEYREPWPVCVERALRLRAEWMAKGGGEPS